MDGAPTFLYSGTAPSITGFNQWETLVDVDGPVLLRDLYCGGEVAPSTTIKRYLKVSFGDDVFFAYGFSEAEGQNYSTNFPLTITTEADNSTPATDLVGMPLGEKELKYNYQTGVKDYEFAFYGPIYSPGGLKIQYAIGQTENKSTGDSSKLKLDVMYELIGG